MTGRNQILPLIAAITMFIDHVGMILFPSVIWLRVIGRISFPLFAYGIAMGVIHTSDFKQYVMRILLAAAISQPICMMAMGRIFSNPLFTLAYGAVVLHLWRENKKTWSIGMMILCLFLPFEYGSYGVFTIFVFGILEDVSLNFGMILLQIYFYVKTGSWIQYFSLLALPLIQKEWNYKVTLPKYMLYWFYPVHLLMLVGIKALLF